MGLRYRDPVTGTFIDLPIIATGEGGSGLPEVAISDTPPTASNIVLWVNTSEQNGTEVQTITYGTADPSGGNNGDVYFKIV